MSELALGFVDAHPAITSTIIGPKSMAQLKDNIACADVELSNDVLDAIDKVVRPGTMAPRTINMAPNPPMEAKNRRR
jgi:aryl-alcohol dehydrogenase (NADP+)